MTQINGNAATTLLDGLGVVGQDQQAEREIPCGHQDKGNDGRAYVCGSIIRGQTYYCRDCMAEMMINASEITQSVVSVLVTATNELAATGAVSTETAQEMAMVVDSLTQPE